LPKVNDKWMIYRSMGLGNNECTDHRYRDERCFFCNRPENNEEADNESNIKEDN